MQETQFLQSEFAKQSPLDHVTFSVLAAAHTVISNEWDGRDTSHDPYSRLYLVTSGAGTIEVRGRRRVLEPGNLYLVPSNETYKLCSGRGMGHFWFHFTARFAAGISVFALLQTPFQVPANADALRGARDVVDTCERDATVLRFMLVNRIRLLLEPFIQEASWTIHPNHYDRFTPALTFVEEHLGEDISVTDLAAIVNLHPTYFANKFSACVGMAPKAYVQSRRIEVAQMLLLHNDKPVKAIAAETGFHDVAYFCRVFRRRTGMTPGEYRNRGPI